MRASNEINRAHLFRDFRLSQRPIHNPLLTPTNSPIKMSKDFLFPNLPKIAKREPCLPQINEAEAKYTKVRLGLTIYELCASSLKRGPDPQGVQNRRQVNSLNHWVLYARLEGDGQIRFSMENREESKKGEEADGVLVVKFHDFTSLSHKTAMAVERTWKPSRILTLRQLILFVIILGPMNLSGPESYPDVVCGCKISILTLHAILPIENLEGKWRESSSKPTALTSIRTTKS